MLVVKRGHNATSASLATGIPGHSLDIAHKHQSLSALITFRFFGYVALSGCLTLPIIDKIPAKSTGILEFFSIPRK